MPPKTSGRKKQNRNISGLRNQQKEPKKTPRDEGVSCQSPNSTDSEDDNRHEEHYTGLYFDSLKPILMDEDEDEGWEGTMNEEKWEDVESVILQENLRGLAAELADNSDDEEWLPPILAIKRKRKETTKPRPMQYAKGPDVGSKSDRTKRRYRKLLKNQSSLSSFGFRAAAGPSTIEISSSDSSDSGVDDTQPMVLGTSDMNHTSEDIESEADIPSCPLLDNTPSEAITITGNAESDELEGWEEELEENILPARTEVKGWDKLRKQIKTELKKKHKTLTISQHNQLLVLRNFATLHLKGFRRIDASLRIAEQWHEGKGTYLATHVRALARFYQVFERLPDEKRGGLGNAQSWLKDEAVQNTCREWLTAQQPGSITPQAFRHAINSDILPSLRITLAKPLCERTARRWLVRLGYRLTRIKKGVYMDGHERDDVVKYRNEEFLPKVEKWGHRMVHFEGPDLIRVEPTLAEGETEIVEYYHDECAIKAFESKSRAWLLQGQSLLVRKGQGCLIHVSDFISPLNGRCVQFDTDGKIIADARKITYPGSNGDPWWDTEQLIKQVKAAIKIHEAAHPGKTALFIFDQSSAHASLAPDALKAFEMNKSDGGKQRKQCDTVIPMTNPEVAFRGKPQTMTLPDGQAKGLERVLKEWGFKVDGMRAKCSPVCPWENTDCCMAQLMSRQDDFSKQESMLESVIKAAGHLCIFLLKFHCELNPIEMYWGWVKYRFQEERKSTFAEAKKIALEKLDACPIEVIRRFINRSARFMSAYRLGLTGKAAAWAV